MQVNCKFEKSFFKPYECDVVEATINQRCEVVVFQGVHKVGKSFKDVEVLSFDNTVVHYIPSGLHKIFPRLKTLKIHNCGLREIESDDLLGLEHLEQLWLDKNNLKFLPDDLFVHTRKLTAIIFSSNELEFMSSRILAPIPDQQWQLVSFRHNTKIDVCYTIIFKSLLGNVKSVQELKDAIDASCSSRAIQPAPPSSGNTNNFKKIWDLKKYFDLTIVTNTNPIRVHKCVLAAQSSVFASMLENDEQGAASNKIEMKECSGEIVKEFLQSLYTSEVDNEEHALELFRLACDFDVEELKTIYEPIVVKNMNEENAFVAFKLGNLQKSEAIIVAAFQKIKEMYPNEIHSDALKYEPGKVEEVIKHRKLIEELNKEK